MGRGGTASRPGAPQRPLPRAAVPDSGRYGNPAPRSPCTLHVETAGDPAPLRRLLETSERPLLVVGPLESTSDESSTLASACASLGMVVLADIGSNLRGRGGVISNYETALLAGRALPEPDLVIHAGGLPTSKRLRRWLGKLSCRQVRLTSNPAWVDPDGCVTDVVFGTPSLLAGVTSRASHSTWQRKWQVEAESWATLLAEATQADREMYEALYARLSDVAPERCSLFFSNSLPIRDADLMLAGTQSGQRIHVNRGVNGIDGITSTAIGCAVADDSPLLLVTGDVAFLHDANALMPARTTGVRGVILVVNNDGGGIFSHLPGAAGTPAFAETFTTPHGLCPAEIARAYGLDAIRVDTVAACLSAIAERVHAPLGVVELTVDLQSSLEIRRRFEQRLQLQRPEVA